MKNPINMQFLKFSFILFLAFFLSCDNTKKNDDITIGVILPLTGKFAVIGEGEQKGINLAIDSLKKKFPNKKIKVIFEDFASETKNAVTAANKLISIDKVDAIITSTTSASEAVSPIIDKAKMIHFVISPDIEIVNKSKYNFRIYYSFNTEAEVIDKFFELKNPKSISILASNYSSLQKLVDDKLNTIIAKREIELKSKEMVDVADKDFKNSILKIKNDNSSLYFLAPMTNQVDLYTKQLNDANIKPAENSILLGSFTFNWKPIGFLSTLEGYYIISPVFQVNEVENSFVKKFVQVNNVKPSFDVAFAYDNTITLVNILIDSKKDFTKFKDKFNSIGSIKGASGKINFIGNNETNAEIVVTKIVNGKQVQQ